MWKYPAWAEDKIKGVSYKVITVESNFSEGKFTQDLSCVINTFSDVEAGATGTNPRESAETNDASQSLGQANREEQAKSDASKQEQATDAASSEREIPISPQARTDANDDRSGT